MKLNKSSQLALVSAASLLAATLVTACSQLTQTLTVDFVYVASSKAAGSNNYGEIDIFEVNSESGLMRQIPASPVPSEGRYPVSEAVSSDSLSLFVANQDDNNIVQFVIGNDGKLYPYNTVNTPGVYPLAITANKSNLFVVDIYQPLPSCSTAAPCSGSIAVFPLTAGGSGSSAPCTASVCIQPAATNSAISAQYWPLAVPGKPTDVIVPTGVYVQPSGNYVYVTAYDAPVTPGTPISPGTQPPPGTPTTGYVFAFAVGSGGVLTPVTGSPFLTSTQTSLPSAIAGDSTGKYVFVTDAAQGNVLGFTASSGVLTPTPGSPFKAGDSPSAIVVDQSFNFAYVANSTDSNISAYSMSNGVLTNIGTFAAGQQPVALGIDPSTAHFLYAANFLGNTISGYELSETSGSLLVAQASPYACNDQPTAVAAIPHNGTGGGVH